jgi:hypothetical protein
MSNVVTIGLDIAKSVFQLHGIDASGAVVLRRRLPRSRMLAFFEKQAPCLVGLEACGTSHYWGRELSRLGHDVRLIPPSYVKPYVKRQKNDAADAEAICEAVTRPNMRFVPIKSPEQQSIMIAHRTRAILTRQRTQLSNAIRGHMAEFGLVAPVGRNGLEMLIAIIADAADKRVPIDARAALRMLIAQLRLVNEQILESDRQIIANARGNSEWRHDCSHARRCDGSVVSGSQWRNKGLGDNGFAHAVLQARRHRSALLYRSADGSHGPRDGIYERGTTQREERDLRQMRAYRPIDRVALGIEYITTQPIPVTPMAWPSGCYGRQGRSTSDLRHAESDPAAPRPTTPVVPRTPRRIRGPDPRASQE